MNSQLIDFFIHSNIFRIFKENAEGSDHKSPTWNREMWPWIYF